MIQADVVRLVVEIGMGLIGFLALQVMTGIKRSIDDTRNSVDELNVKVAHIIEKTAWHEKTIETHDERLRILETKG